MSFQQNGNSANVNERQERGIELVIAGKDSSEPFELLEKALDQMAFLVSMPVHRPRITAVVLWWNSISCTLGSNVLKDHSGTICLVSKNIASLGVNFLE